MATNYYNNGSIHYSSPNASNNAANKGTFNTKWFWVGQDLGPCVTVEGLGAGDSVTPIVSNFIAASPGPYDTPWPNDGGGNPQGGAPHPIGPITAPTPFLIGAPYRWIRYQVNNTSGDPIYIFQAGQAPK